MEDVYALGPAWAWQDDARKWFYTTSRTTAPPQAIQVERVVIGALTVLCMEPGEDSGRFIWEATEV